MEIIMQIWSSILFFGAGLAIGRIRWIRLEEEGQNKKEKVTEDTSVREGEEQPRKKISGEKRIPVGFTVGSPVSGNISYFDEDGKKGVLIEPGQGILYAPAAGKIVGLFPTGNAMRLKTDGGVELLLQAGIGTGDLETRYYRPRVVKNEVVNKGKPLLEFDVEGIRKEGYDPSVKMVVDDTRGFEKVAVCESKQVKAGEDLLWMQQ